METVRKLFGLCMRFDIFMSSKSVNWASRVTRIQRWLTKVS